MTLPYGYDPTGPTEGDTVQREVVRQLNAVLGPTLVASLAGARDRKLPNEWARDDGGYPAPAAWGRLQFAHQIWATLAEEEGADNARAWFIGGNPHLGEDTPITAIREDRYAEVRRAMRLFVQGYPLSEWDRLVGPFYNLEGVSRWQGEPEEVIRKDSRFLRLPTADGEMLFPTFQFGPNGELLPHLDEVIWILRFGLENEWSWALWLNTPLDVWGGRTAAQMLRASTEDVDAVLDMAYNDVARRIQDDESLRDMRAKYKGD